MVSNPRVRELLEVMLDSGCTPEEACSDSPELLYDVHEAWARHKAMRAQIGELFPDPETSIPGTEAYSKLEPVLPNVAGYEVQMVLGHGGMGVVYKAWHLGLKRQVALKMLLAGAYAKVEDRERILREAEAVAALRHANIVQIFDIGDHDGRPYFTMEYVEGGSLARKLAGTPQPAQQAAAMVTSLADAVQITHECGIVHRDLKPANILLTADGTPKITDFGLALLPASGSALTLTGEPLGTPSYMSPCQARGDRKAIGPATDIYALGAILYEMLTGRPPFRGETAAETLQQVISQEPVPPSKLNPKVPRDLETVCLKCLEKKPSTRYASAADLASDLRRFEQGAPITARRVGPLERTWRWARRRPALAAFTAALAVAVMLTGTLIFDWSQARQRQLTNARAIQGDLLEIGQLQKHSAWDRARAVLDRATGRLTDEEPGELRLRLDQIATELQLAIRLENVRLTHSRVVDGFSGIAADRDYESAFSQAGLGDLQEDPAAVAARVQASGIRAALIGALDDWAVSAPDKKRQTWCLDVARKADPDSDAWRSRARDATTWQDKHALSALAASAAVDQQPVHLLVAVGEHLQNHGKDAIAFLKRVQAEHPGDFWANFRLANALVKKDPNDAIGYYRAALAIRPDTVVVANNLGMALKAAGKLDESIGSYERAIRIDPQYAPAHSNLGVALKAKGKLDEAFASFRRAEKIDPNFAPALGNLGNAYRGKGDLAKAVEYYERSAKAAPTMPEPHFNLGKIAKTPEEKVRHFEKAIALNANLFQAHNALGTVLYEQGRLDDAIACFQRAVAIMPSDSICQKNLATALKTKAERDEKSKR